MRILTFTNLYPNRVQPRHGIFVEQRLLHLVESGQVQARVVAPVPWFPFKAERFGRYAQYARIPDKETRNGIDVIYPRYLSIPKLGMSLAPHLLATAMRKWLHAVRSDGFDFDILDAHYFYPDGVAAVKMARKFNKPAVITARGSDINEIPKHTLARRMILWAASQCAAIITVSAALKERLLEMGVDKDKIYILKNGVDLNKFCPLDSNDAKKRLNVTGQMILSVGNLVEEKGHDLTLRALARLPDINLTIVGNGNRNHQLSSLAQSLGLANRVRFVASVPQEDLKYYYSAADALVLSSTREGMPNVVLESLACGTPVVAANVGGVSEVVTSSEAGTTFDNRDPEVLARKIMELLKTKPDRSVTRTFAEQFDWEKTITQQLKLYSSLI